MDTKEQNNLIWNVVAFTSAVIILFFIVCGAICALVFPKIYADTLFSFGLRNASLPSYEYQYEKSDDISDLYILLTHSIVAQNNNYIISSFETLSDLEGYPEFIITIQNSNLSNCLTKTQMLYVANEDNYLKTNYVKSLFKTGSKQEAFSFSILDLVDNENTAINEKHNFVIGEYINDCIESSDYSYFNDENIGQIYTTYTNKWNTYCDAKSTLDADSSDYILNKFYLSVITYRLMDISRAMLKLDNNITQTIFSSSTITSNLSILSNDLSTFTS